MAKRSKVSSLAVMRRHRNAKRFIREYGEYIIATVVIVAVIVAVAAIALAKGTKEEADRQQDGRIEASVNAVADIEPIEQEETAESILYPFNQMSRDWDGEDLMGFTPYTIPQEYKEDGGMFPEVMQEYTYIICTQNGVDYAVVVAVIEHESGYKWDAGGEEGDMGYMQIVERWHKDRMERLNAKDMKNPYQNVRVGIDYMAELLEKYGGDYEKTLTAYQYGSTGAYKFFFSAGVNASPYAKNVLGTADRVREDMKTGGQRE